MLLSSNFCFSVLKKVVLLLQKAPSLLRVDSCHVTCLICVLEAHRNRTEVFFTMGAPSPISIQLGNSNAETIPDNKYNKFMVYINLQCKIFTPPLRHSQALKLFSINSKSILIRVILHPPPLHNHLPTLTIDSLMFCKT